MDRRESGLLEAMRAGAAQNARARRRSDTKRRENRPAGALAATWTSVMREVFGEELEVPKWRGEDRGLARKLVKDLGLPRAEAVVEHFVRTWEARQTGVQRMRGDMPSIKLCWVLRQKLLAELDGLVNVPAGKAELLAKGEYSEEAAELSPKRGWGDVLEKP